jgi:hypothetical protein
MLRVGRVVLWDCGSVVCCMDWENIVEREEFCSDLQLGSVGCYCKGGCGGVCACDRGGGS